jgi:hypothetical protein
MATLIPGIGTSADTLHAELRTLIANSRPRVAASFPDAAIVSTLSTQFGLSHMVAIAALKNLASRPVLRPTSALRLTLCAESGHEQVGLL